jgi:transcriptional regulator with XRE-family HTH domain
MRLDSVGRKEMATVGTRIHQIRKENGLSKQAFAQIFDIDRHTVTRWERDCYKPNRERLLLMSGKFDVSVDWILSGLEASSGSPNDNEDTTDELNPKLRRWISEVVSNLSENELRLLKGYLKALETLESEV